MSPVTMGSTRFPVIMIYFSAMHSLALATMNTHLKQIFWANFDRRRLDLVLVLAAVC